MRLTISAIIILTLILLPGREAWGWGQAGGARDATEMKEIETLAQNYDFQKICPLASAIKKLKSDARVKEMVGRTTLYRETRCDPNETIAWAEKEPFPSLGLPHVVWFPPGVNRDEFFDESFPRMWAYLRHKYQTSDRGDAVLPEWVDPKSFPWANRQAFLNDKSKRMKEFRDFINDPNSLKWQAEYALERGLQSGYKILAASALESGGAPSAVICKTLQKLLRTGIGALSVVDFTNFKGEGIHPKEIRGNVRWGLKQVLERMGTMTPERISRQLPLDKSVRANTRDQTQLAFMAAALEGFEARAYAEKGKDHEYWLGYLSKDGKGGIYNRVTLTYTGNGVPPAMCKLYPAAGNATVSPASVAR